MNLRYQWTQYSLLLTGQLILSACGGSGGNDAGPGETPNGGDGGQTTNLPLEFNRWLKDMSANHIIPAYTAFRDNSQTLATNAVAFCAVTEQSQNDLTALQADWMRASQSWQQIQWLKVGPVVDSSRLFRIQFWPDSNDAVDKGLASLLERDEVVTTEYVSGRNVGAQGLPALESLLFADQVSSSLLTAEDKDKRCEVLTAISGNLANIADELATAWSESGGNYQATFIQGTGEFSGQVDVVEELVTNWLEQLERVKDEKMLAPLADAVPGLPELTESYPSDTSLHNIKTNIDALLAVYTAGNGHGFDDILIAHLEQDSIASQMLEALSRAQQSIDKIDGSYVNALQSVEGRVALEEVIEALRDFRTVLSADFIQALDINIGFNANDGD